VGWAATTAEHVYEPCNIRHQCEQSLRNLRTDVIDLYYLHHCDFGENDRYLPDALNEVAKLKAAGKIRLSGLSGYSFDELERVARVMHPDVIQSWADVEHDEFIRPDQPLRRLMDEMRISFVAMMPFGQGRLLGKYDAKQPPTFPPGDNRRGNRSFEGDSLALLSPRLEDLRRRFGRKTEDLARVALQYVLAQPVVASVIPGFRNVQQVLCNAAASDLPLTAEELKAVADAFPRSEMTPHPWT
jgi:aryl-alcohol dehydrogenase-like predicted oxidoreductase